MPLKYPANTIWYIRSTKLDGNDTAEGSAVAIRLQKIDQPKTAKTYLLTCGHVIRGTTERKRIICAWPPDVGKVDSEGCRVEVNTEFKDLPNGELSEAERRNCADDWVILGFDENKVSSGIEAVRNWIGDEFSEDVNTWGYPGGELSFQRGKVIPTKTDAFSFHDAAQGVINLTGDGTRRGISGGGAFSNFDTRFAGLHRHRLDEALQVSVVSSLHIRQRMYELGYEPVPYWSKGTYTLPDVLLDEIAKDTRICREVLTKALPLSSTYELPTTLNDRAHLAKALHELAELGADDKGIQPFFRFVYELIKHPHVAETLPRMLDEWFDVHCPPVQRQQLGVVLDARVIGEPRIVVQMIRAESNNECSPRVPASSSSNVREALFHFKIWFVGFPHVPMPQEHVDTCDGLKSILEQAWVKVRGHCDPQLVLVELFLPKELFTWAVEKEQVRVGPFAAPILGAKHRFLLRFARSQCSKPMETRWNSAVARSMRLQQPIRLNCDLPLPDVPKQTEEEHFMVAIDANPEGCDAAEIHFELMKRPNILGVHWTSPPAPDPSDGDVWDAVFESGVPLILWLREPAPPHCSNANPTIHFRNREWDTIASEVQRLRLNAVNCEEWEMGQHLAIILDDPRRPLPSASPSARFRSPASTI